MFTFYLEKRILLHYICNTSTIQVHYYNNTIINKVTMQTNTTIKLSPRRLVNLTKEEVQQLKNFIAESPKTAKAEIKSNTGIHYRTISSIIENEKCELKVAVKIREFIKLIASLK